MLSTAQLDSAWYYSHIDTVKSKHFLFQAEKNNATFPQWVNEFLIFNWLFTAEKYDEAEQVLLTLQNTYGNSERINIKINLHLAKVYNKQGDLEKSKLLCEQIIANPLSTANDKVIALNNIADMLLNENKTIDALSYLKYANIIAVNEICPDLAVSFLYLSYVYANEGINNKIEPALQHALVYAKALKNPVVDTKLINNIGVFYFINEQFDSAKYYFHYLQNRAHEIGFLDQEIIALFNLSNVEYNNGNLDSAMKYLDEVFAMKDKVNPRLLSRTYYTYGVIKHDQGLYIQSIENLEKAKRSSVEMNNHNLLLLIYEILASSYAGAGRYKDAFETQRAYSILSDSINDSDRLLAFDIFESEIDLLEKNNRIIQQDLDLSKLHEENQRIRTNTRNTIIVSIFIILIVFNFAIFYILRKKYAMKKQFAKDVMDENEKFRYRIAAELHDDIGQQLSLILHRDNIKEDHDLKNKIGSALESLRNLSKLIYPQTLNIMGLIPLLRKMLHEIEDKQKITTHLLVSESIETHITHDCKLNIFRILQECTSNSIKHSNSNNIHITFKAQKNILNIYYKDNGTHPENAKLHHGFGLSSMTMRAEMIDSKIQFFLYPSGFSMQLTIPIQDTFTEPVDN